MSATTAGERLHGVMREHGCLDEDWNDWNRYCPAEREGFEAAAAALGVAGEAGGGDAIVNYNSDGEEFADGSTAASRYEASRRSGEAGGGDEPPERKPGYDPDEAHAKHAPPGDYRKARGVLAGVFPDGAGVDEAICSARGDDGGEDCPPPWQAALNAVLDVVIENDLKAMRERDDLRADLNLLREELADERDRAGAESAGLWRAQDADRKRIAEVEGRIGALDGSVAPAERYGIHVERWCPHCGGIVRLDAVLRAKGAAAALEARGADPLRTGRAGR